MGSSNSTMLSDWLPTTSNNQPGWRLDAVTLLAVIGESSITDHSQTITASTLCLLPRIIPAPQALLRADRPMRMPDTPAKMAGVYSGVVLDSVGFFANIIQPLNELPAFAFKVIDIKHRDVNEASGYFASPKSTGASALKAALWRRFSHRSRTAATTRSHLPGPPTLEMSDRAGAPNGTASHHADLERGTAVQSGPDPAPGNLRRRRTTKAAVQDFVTLANKQSRPAVPAQLYSPVHILSVFSFMLTVGIMIAAARWTDGVAIMGVGLISLASSIVGYASWWEPILMNRSHTNRVPEGDLVIRTRVGAFIYVRCTEEVARELFSGTEECRYRVGERLYRVLMGLGTVLLMISVVLLGNCNFLSQVLISISYIVLNGLYWSMGLLPQRYFWDMSRYEWTDVTPVDADGAEGVTNHDDHREGHPSFTRTLWYAVRETRKTGWVLSTGAAPRTRQWERWLDEALAAARKGERDWAAVARKDEIMSPDPKSPSAAPSSFDDHGEEEQHAPAVEIQGTRPVQTNAGSL